MIIERFPVMLRCCWFGLNHLFRQRISKLPITTVQFTVLRTIYESRSKKLNQRELAKLISSNKNNLSSIVRRLEGLEYIVLTVNPIDKRENNINITSKGIKIFYESKKIAIGLQDKITADLKTYDVNNLSYYLVRINKKLSTITADDSEQIK